MYSTLGVRDTVKIRQKYLSYFYGTYIWYGEKGWEQGKSQERKKQDNLNSNNGKCYKDQVHAKSVEENPIV